MESETVDLFQTTRRPGMHFSKFANSRQLQRVHAFLVLRGSAGATTREIIDGTGDCAISTIIKSLRMNGFSIPPAIWEGRNQNGQQVCRYVLLNPDFRP